MKKKKNNNNNNNNNNSYSNSNNLEEGDQDNCESATMPLRSSKTRNSRFAILYFFFCCSVTRIDTHLMYICNLRKTDYLASVASLELSPGKKNN